MKIIDAIILIEHINRELESAVLLKIELKKRGYSVELASVFWGFGKSLVKYRPKLVITPWAYDSREMNLILLFKGGYKDGSFFILNTHQEQVTYIDAQQFMIPRENARNCFHIAWGDFYRNLLLESGIKEETIRITGSPRLELFSKEYWVLSYSRNELAEEYKLDKDKKWILILGNFSFAFFSERKIESLYNRGNKASYDLKKEQLYVLSVITEWLDGLCEEYGDLFEIIYRPHPSERSYEKHKHLENKYQCFHIIKEKTVRDWIINSDVCFTWNSTSSVGAAFADKPVYALRPRKMDDSLRIPLLDKLPVIDNYENFLSIINLIETGKIYKCSKNFSDSLLYYYSYVNQNPTKLIGDFIDYIFDADKNYYYPLGGDNSLYRYYIYTKQIAKNILRVLGIINLIPKYRVQKTDYLSRYDINKIETALLLGVRNDNKQEFDNK